MDTISINVKVKSESKPVSLVLYHKIYSTPNGIVNYWVTNNNSSYRLEVIIDGKDLSVNPSNIIRDMNILNDEWDIADQVMLKLHEKRVFETQNA